MKMIIIVCSMLFTFALCCTDADDNTNTNDATITGIDSRECSCCGGYFIEISSSTYRFYTVPAGSNVDIENATFPLNVRVTWKTAANRCLGDEIEVLKLELR